MKKIMYSMLMLVLVSSYGWAANYDNPVSGVFKGSYGDSISVEIPSNVSKSPDNVQNGDLTFQIVPDTIYKGFNKLTDLQKGEAVQVEYKVADKGNKMIASIISINNNSSEVVVKKTTVTTTTSTSY